MLSYNHKNTSWSKRIIAIKKIESLSVKGIEDVGRFQEMIREVEWSFGVIIDGNQCTISRYVLPQYYGMESDFLHLYDCRNRSKEVAVDRAILKFIRWYNKQK